MGAGIDDDSAGFEESVEEEVAWFDDKSDDAGFQGLIFCFAHGFVLLRVEGVTFLGFDEGEVMFLEDISYFGFDHGESLMQGFSMGVFLCLHIVDRCEFKCTGEVVDDGNEVFDECTMGVTSEFFFFFFETSSAIFHFCDGTHGFVLPIF